ncbi:vomeronasal type-2 receptor 26-like [Protopterus annectens]|uniref:vomeronasal type-2 receptor 26-like n=1 Tax=Protopterus annectens TaxID=7888 RepID=UPI001CFA8984|nr:vomeronasal type-2 receptor 26-like [Protopterus annectens]
MVMETFFSLFTKGFKYVPKHTSNIARVIMDLKIFIRNLNLENLYGTDSNIRDRSIPSRSSTFNPPIHPQLRNLELRIEKRIRETTRYKRFTPNLDPFEHDLLIQLSKNSNVRVMEPNKRGGIVLMDKIVYEGKMNSILYDETRYSHGYPESMVNSSESEIWAERQGKYGLIKSNGTFNRNMIVQYFLDAEDIESIIHKNWLVFECDDTTKLLGVQKTSFFYKMKNNIKNLLEGSSLNPVPSFHITQTCANRTQESRMSEDRRHRWNVMVPKSVCSESCPMGHRKAARRGEPVCCYDCVPCSKGEISNQTDASECHMCPEMHWSDEKHEKCIPKTIEFLSYEETLGAVPCTISLLICLLSAFVLCVFIRYRDTPIVKANNRDLSYLILVSLILCSLCSLIFIGHPERITCVLRQTTFGFIFSFSVSCIMSKTITVVLAFNATKPNSRLRNWVGPRISTSVVICGSFIQLLICISWLVISPPFSKQNSEDEGGKIIIECDDGSHTAFWFMLGYMGVLSIVSFLVAFLAKSLPDNFNEAKFIAFSMLVFVSVWLSFIPAYLSTKGKYMVAVEIFAILSSTSGMLSCIFFPKCYVILIRPELNTREQLMGKKNNKNKI